GPRNAAISGPREPDRRLFARPRDVPIPDAPSMNQSRAVSRDVRPFPCLRIGGEDDALLYPSPVFQNRERRSPGLPIECGVEVPPRRDRGIQNVAFSVAAQYRLRTLFERKSDARVPAGNRRECEIRVAAATGEQHYHGKTATLHGRGTRNFKPAP